VVRRRPVFLRGTRAPFSRASDRPIAIACFRLVTFVPLRPLLRVPRFRRRIADFTALPAPLLYLAINILPWPSYAGPDKCKRTAITTVPPDVMARAYT
jgi:hypothetical protein